MNNVDKEKERKRAKRKKEWAMTKQMIRNYRANETPEQKKNRRNFILTVILVIVIFCAVMAYNFYLSVRSASRYNPFAEITLAPTPTPHPFIVD